MKDNIVENIYGNKFKEPLFGHFKICYREKLK